MSSDNPTLDRFIQTVPCYSYHLGLSDLLGLFQSGQHQQVVILNLEEHPIGIIRSQSLVKLLLEQNQENGEDWLTLLEPMVLLPGEMTIEALKNNLPQISRDSCGLVNEQGKFLGILDFNNFLAFLLKHSNQLSSVREVKELKLRDFVLPNIQQSEINPQYSGNNYSYEGNILPPELALKSVFYLLEEFPLPVMLKTGEGEILYNNFLWRKQLGNSFVQDYPEEFEQPYNILENQSPIWQIDQDILASGLGNRSGLEQVKSCIKFLSMEGQEDNKKESQDKGMLWELVQYPLNFTGVYYPLYLIFAKDVTAQQKLFKQLEKKNLDLLLLNQIKNDFLNSLSHEIKSPLTAIVGLSSLLKEQSLGTLNERQCTYAELIYQNSKKSIGIINNFLDLNRLEKDNTILKKNTISFDQIQQFIQEYLENKDKRISCATKVDREIVTIEADESRLYQMLGNLLDNAIRFTSEGGTIGLNIEIWQNFITFTVWDKGSGIPQDYQHLILQNFSISEKFFHSSWHKEWENRGMGLLLTQSLTKLHGGDISFISEVGIGSEFTILLPVNIVEIKKNIPRKNKEIILIVSYLNKYTHNLTRILKKLDYGVVVARSGVEGIEKAQFLHPKAIIINPILPLLSGWELLNNLKSDVSTQDIPIIVAGNDNDKKKARKYGANWFISLPTDQETLANIFSGKQKQLTLNRENVTVLCLHPEPRKTGWVANMVNHLLEIGMEEKIEYRIVQADDLEQAETIARVWKIDVIVFDGTVADLSYIRSLSESQSLAALPLITLDAKTTGFANQFSNLKVFPCLISPSEEGLSSLWDVVQIVLQNEH